MACFPAARSNFALTRDLHESCGYTQSSSFAEKQSCARCSIEYDSRVVVCPSDGERWCQKQPMPKRASSSSVTRFLSCWEKAA